MKGKPIQFQFLSRAVLTELEALGYKNSTLTNYRRIYARIENFMSDNSIEEYSPFVGKAFVAKHYPDDTKASGSVILMIRRLDDYLNNVPYRCHRVIKAVRVPADFRQIFDDYLVYCTDNGNKSGTINRKKGFCLIFLQFLDEIGLKDISLITAETVANGCLRYSNKEGYATLRQFLKYLFEHGIIAKDLSAIVPYFKRRQTVPTVYSPEEIRKIEGAIDTSTDTGKRNLSIILLVTRMGLRSGDVVSLKLSEIDFSSGHIDLIQKKTGEPLSIFMPQDVSFALKSYIGIATNDLSDGYVFHSMKAPHGRITTSIIRHIVQECIISAGIDMNERKHGPHALRSSLASSLVSGGASYDTVRKILGHTAPNAIKHYVKTDIERLRQCAISPPTPTGIFLDLICGRRRI